MRNIGYGSGPALRDAVCDSAGIAIQTSVCPARLPGCVDCVEKGSDSAPGERR